MRRKRGFTLIEVLVVCALLMLLLVLVVATLQMAFGRWGTLAQRFRSAQQARFVLTTIENEMRQGLPWRDGTYGYLRVGAIPSAMLLPNDAQKRSAQVEFTESNPTYYLPMVEAWNPEAANNFRGVTYRVRGGDEVVREVVSYDHIPPRDPEVEVISSLPERTDGLAAFELDFEYLDPNLCQITVTGREGRHTARVSTRCFLVGR